ncbi:hypothetical protein ABPG74_008036 [Tetrahymena malaccensis]
MLRQHLVRENIAKENLNENQDLNSKKYYIRQNISINRQIPLVDTENASNSFNLAQKPIFSNQIKQLDNLKQVSQQESQDSSLETSFNYHKNNQNKFFLKLLIPLKGSQNSSPKSTNKLDQLNSNESFNSKLSYLRNKQASPSSQNHLYKRERQKELNGKQQINPIQIQQIDIRKNKSKSFLNLKQINSSLLNEEKEKNLLIQNLNEQKNESLNQNINKRKYQINVGCSQTNKQINSLNMPTISSPSYSMSPCRISRLDSYSKFNISNTPTSISGGQLLDFQQINETTPNQNINKEKRRSSLNLNLAHNQQENQQIQHTNHPRLSIKKESRIASLTRLQEEDKNKFIEEAQKMYIEKRIIADEEDLKVVSKMQLDQNEYKNIDNIIQYSQNNKIHQLLKDLYKQNQQSISKQQSFSTDKNAQSFLQNKRCKRHSSVIGIKAPQIVIQNCQKPKKIIQLKEIPQEKSESREIAKTKLLNPIIDNKILPRKLSLIPINRSQNSLSFSNYNGRESSLQQSIQDSFSQLAQKDTTIIQPFQQKTNNTNQQIYQILLKSAPEQILELNLSKNELNIEMTTLLLQKFFSQNSKLQILNLENCKINDQVVNSLMDCLLDNSSIKKLNLSQNQITSKSCQNIKKVLSENYYLEELYLHWNLIKGDGGALIAQGLQVNTTLNVLDLSKNPLGGDQNKLSCSLEVKRFLMYQQSNIVHLDLSNCGFNLQESTNIQEGLIKNHTVYGFHFSGNVGTVDGLGFLNFNNHINSFRNIHLNHRIDGVNSLSFMLLKDRSLVSVDNCWICEGWEQQEIKIDVSQFDDNNTIRRVFVHLDFLEFKGIQLTQKQNDNIYYLKVMCPPNQIVKFFFTIPEQKIQILSPSYPFSQILTLGLDIPSQILYQEDPLISMNLDPEIKQINILQTKVGKAIDEETFHPLIECYPRPSIKNEKQQQKVNQITACKGDKRKQIMHKLLNNTINFHPKIPKSPNNLIKQLNISKNQIIN